MNKLYITLIIAIVITIIYFIYYKYARKEDEKLSEDDLSKKLILLFFTIFVVSYCGLTLVYEGGLSNTKKQVMNINNIQESVKSGIDSGNGYDVINVDNLSEMIENIEVGEPPF